MAKSELQHHTELSWLLHCSIVSHHLLCTANPIFPSDGRGGCGCFRGSMRQDFQPPHLEKWMKLYIDKQSINGSFISLVVLVSSYFLQKSKLFYQASLSKAANPSECWASQSSPSLVLFFNFAPKICHFSYLKKSHPLLFNEEKQPKERKKKMQWENKSILILPAEQSDGPKIFVFMWHSRTSMYITIAHILQMIN